MQKKNNNKRLRNLIFLIILIIIIYLIVYLIPKNYKFEYNINGFKVTENYNKKDKIYSFVITNKKEKYKFISDKKYTPNRKLIKKIKEYKNGDVSCIVLESKQLNNNIYCLKNNEMLDYHLVDIIPKKYLKSKKYNKIKFKDINMNLIDDKTYLVWNYNKLYEINDKEKISVFKKDVYNIDINVIIDNYLILADYDQEYNFSKFKIINLKNNKIEEFKFNYEISFDSRIIGIYKNSFYLVDNKNKKEYEINIKKKKIEIISNGKYGKILKNGEFEKIKLNKIIADNLEFDKNYNYKWIIKNEKLYLKQKGINVDIKISNKKIKNIVYQNDYECFYIVDDKLYKYSFEYGEQKVLEYFELNFNYENMIYIYE